METKRYFRNLLPERHNEQEQSLPLVYTAHPEEVDEGGLELGQLLAALRRRALVIAGVTVAVASASLAYALTSTPVYEAKFELLINPVTVENKLTASSPLSEATQKEPSFVDLTELSVLQSPKLMSPIFKQIRTQYPNSYPPSLDFTAIKGTSILQVSYQDPNPAKVQFVLDLVSKAYLAYSLEERLSDVRKGTQFVEEQLPGLRQQVEKLQEELQKFRQRHGLIDPAGKSQQLSNQLNGIVQQRLDTRTQLAKTQSLYTSVQNQLALQKSEALAAAALSQAPRYQNLLNQIQDLKTKIAIESARYREDSPTIQNLRAQQQSLLPLLEQERLTVLGGELSKTIDKSRSLASPNSIRLQQIQQFFDAANQLQVLKAQDQALAQAENLSKQQVRELPALTRQNDNLERQLKIATDNLNQFLTKREALRIDAAQKQVPWQLITPPTKPQASLASAKLNLILGATLGLFLGIGAALLVDKFKNVFYTPKEVKDTTRLPLLGEIPLLADVTGLAELVASNFKIAKNHQGSQQSRTSHFRESFRSLYTNIRFLSFNSPIHSLSIISAAPEEGRSTIAIHLAQTAAAMGHRVLLVDADLRNPKAHTMLNIPNTKGLSNIIIENTDFRDIIHRINCVSLKAQEYGEWRVDKALPLEDVFFVLTAGQVPPNPTSLLSSEKMRELTGQFEAAFDLIIYDTSPLLEVADSSLLTTLTDASLLVVGLGKTNRSIVTKVLEKLKMFSNPVLGVVANGLKE